jgi:hypothetical protein
MTLALLPSQASASNLRAPLFAGVQAFFNAETGAVNDSPDGKIADLDARIVQCSQQRAKRQIGLLRNRLTSRSRSPGRAKGR